ncbi:MAG: hypothetical protein F7C08_00980 [Desulfurococcales archaeon]|nr:hypothetical protein [Desulfurococcales archaeon]MCE4605095.1 hypothetical protein [Desulfurococcales archaeon]
MAMSREARMLAQLLQSGSSLEEAARAMGISMVRARMLVSYLASRGIVKVAPQGCGDCGMCPFSHSCRLARRITYLVRG